MLFSILKTRLNYPLSNKHFYEWGNLMNMPKKLSIIGMVCLIFAFIPTISRADGLPCEKNFTIKEGFFDKKIYTAWQDHLARTITPQLVFMRAYAFLMKEGWIINFTDKEAGIISASQQEGTLGEGGKVATLNIFTEGSGSYFAGPTGGIRVTTIFSVPSGLHAQDEMVKKEFCDILAYIKQY